MVIWKSSIGLAVAAIIAGAGALGTAINDKFVYIQGKVAAAK